MLCKWRDVSLPITRFTIGTPKLLIGNKPSLKEFIRRILAFCAAAHTNSSLLICCPDYLSQRERNPYEFLHKLTAPISKYYQIICIQQVRHKGASHRCVKAPILPSSNFLFDNLVNTSSIIIKRCDKMGSPCRRPWEDLKKP